MLHLSDVAQRVRNLLWQGSNHDHLAVADVAHAMEMRARAAEALAQSEERLRLAMEAAALGTFEWDIATDEVRCSPRVKEQFGFFAEPTITLDSIVSRIHPDDRDAVRATIRAAMESSGPRTYAGEFRTLLPDGSTSWIDARGAVLFGQLNTRPMCMIGIVADITARKKDELRLHQSAEELDTANRRMNEFLGALAHKLRNPLTPIRNGLEILALTGLADPTQRRACDVMGRQLRHLVHIVDELLDASGVTRGTLSLNKELVALQALVRGALEMVGPQLEAGRHNVKVDLPAQTVLLEVDPVRIRQAIGNLLENSAKYTPKGGRIILRTVVDPQGVAIEVADNGIGIDPDLLPHIFDLFSHETPYDHRTGEGLGVGLALTKALVVMHGGAVHAASNGIGTGSLFRIWLPQAKLSDPAGVPPTTSPTPSLPRRRVLVVDDNEDTVSSTATLLSLMGQDVQEARDGLEAVRATEVFEPDVIFMDIGLPGLDGRGAAQRIRQLALPRQPVIVALSAWGEESEQRRSNEAGFDAHLVKPVVASDIIRVLTHLQEYQGWH
jgi:PAS domain S-box-containing protein